MSHDRTQRPPSTSIQAALLWALTVNSGTWKVLKSFVSSQKFQVRNRCMLRRASFTLTQTILWTNGRSPWKSLYQSISRIQVQRRTYNFIRCASHLEQACAAADKGGLVHLHQLLRTVIPLFWDCNGPRCITSFLGVHVSRICQHRTRMHDVDLAPNSESSFVWWCMSKFPSLIYISHSVSMPCSFALYPVLYVNVFTGWKSFLARQAATCALCISRQAGMIVTWRITYFAVELICIKLMVWPNLSTSA